MSSRVVALFKKFTTGSWGTPSTSDDYDTPYISADGAQYVASFLMGTTGLFYPAQNYDPTSDANAWNNLYLMPTLGNTPYMYIEDFGGARQFATPALASAQHQGAYDAVRYAQQVAQAGCWSQTDMPALNAIASTVRAAPGVGARHVITSISACMAATVTTPICMVHLHNGTGADPVIWSGALKSLAGTSFNFFANNLNIVLDYNVAATLEFDAAPGATNQQTVSLCGYTAGLGV